MSGARWPRIRSTCGGSSACASCSTMARARGSTAAIDEAEAAVASVLDLVTGQDVADRPRRPGRGPSRRRRRARSGPSWRTRRAGGFAGELWPNLVEAALELFPRAAPSRQAAGHPPRAREQRFAWIETSATALGLDRVAHPARTRAGTPRGRPPLEEPAPVLLLATPTRRIRWRRASRSGAPSACSLQRATVLERVGAGRSRAAVRVRGVARGRRAARRAAQAVGRAAAHGHARGRPQAEEGAHAAGLAVQLREVRSRGLARGRAAHGGPPGPDAGRRRRRRRRWRWSAAARASDAAASATDVATNPAALDLLRFALGEQYPALRKGGGADGRSPQAVRPRMGSDPGRRRDLRRGADRAVRHRPAAGVPTTGRTVVAVRRHATTTTRCPA